MILTSRNNPLIKEMAALKEKKGRKEQGFFLAEGLKMVSECKRSGLEIGRTFVSESYRGETDENAICVSDEVFAFLSDEKTPQGILCSVRIPKPSLCPPKESCLLLDGVSDPGNMGAIIRTANAAGFGINPESFHVVNIPELTIETGLKMVLVAVACAAISIIFCMVLQGVSKLYAKFLKNPYIRIVAASAIIIVITLFLRTSDYMGAGNNLIELAVENGQARPLDFFWKLVLTALTMRAGFRGGEIVPSFCIGATFGCIMGHLIGLSPSICAAAGMAALFCGVTNCPITSILIAFELFGFRGASYYLIAVSISYAVSGYYGLYKDQTIVYSKYKAKYINRHTRF